MAQNRLLLFSIFFLPFLLSATQAACEELPVLEEALASETKVTDLVAYAYDTNPTIRAAREEWRAKVEHFRVANGYPNPQLMATYFTDPIETRLGPQDWSLTLNQVIPFPGKLASKGRAAAAEARIGKLGLDKTVRDITVAVRQSFHELVYIEKAIEIARQTMELLSHLRKVAETSHAEDRSTLMDVIKAQSQEGQIRYDLLLLEELRETEKTTLNALLGRNPGAPLGPSRAEQSPLIDLTIEELSRLAETHRQEIQMAGLKVEKAEATRQLASLEYLPDLKIGVFYAEIGEADTPTLPVDAGQDAFGVQAGITLPLWFGKNRGKLLEARAQTRRAEALQADTINQTRAAVHKTFFRLRNSQRLVTLYRDELVPQAARAMETAETWFQEDEGSLSDFVETTSTWYNFQLSLARARADYGKYLAGLEQLTGTPLTANNHDSVMEMEETP